MKKKIKKKGKKRMWIVILVILGVIVTGLGGAIALTEPGRREIKNLNIDAVDFDKLHEGVYEGEYKGIKDSLRDTKVQVTVSADKEIDIKLLKGAFDKEGNPAKMRGGLSVDDLSERVIEAQSLQVDVISGATLTSKAHLKAVENALEHAQERR